ncbi:MAG TPA: CPBP family intramembrane glutamic endopeptidase [Myxococcota bacterium]|nr:CPBP family intramembrane glutamic endopeptidase [Myxococcota bacterium]
MLSLVLTALVAWARGSWLGLERPASWRRAIALGVGAGVGIQVATALALEPLVEALTGRPPDVSQFDHIRGDLAALLQWLAIVWVVVVFVEEWVFRGLLARELCALLGSGRAALGIGLATSSLVFGLAHAYQGIGGIVSTGVVGFVLAAITARERWNLWPAVIAHGTIDTIGLWAIYANLDR